MAEDFRALGRELSNWGRWGDDDRVGALNLVTPERVAAAATLARTGRTFSLGLPLGADGPQVGRGGSRMNPKHLMTATGESVFPDGGGYSDDYVFMPLQCATQWDGLGHVFYDGFCYNGVPSSTITVEGSTVLGIDALARGFVGRGVLLDIARLRGVDCLEAGEWIGVADLDAALERQQVAVRPGDILLVRTGWIQKFTNGSAAEYWSGEPGLELECARWLRERDVAAIACDNWSVECIVLGVDRDAMMPFHYVCIRDMGMTLGEIFDLEELAADCERDGVWEFFFCAPVLKFVDAVGTPLNPLAIK
jgi:kynurenine formamidase